MISFNMQTLSLTTLCAALFCSVYSDFSFGLLVRSRFGLWFELFLLRIAGFVSLPKINMYMTLYMYVF